MRACVFFRQGPKQEMPARSISFRSRRRRAQRDGGTPLRWLGPSARGAETPRAHGPRDEFSQEGPDMTSIVELIVLMFVAASGGVVIALLLRSLFHPKPARRLLTLVIEERDTKRPAQSRSA